MSEKCLHKQLLRFASEPNVLVLISFLLFPVTKPRSPVTLLYGQKYDLYNNKLVFGLDVYAPKGYRTNEIFKTHNISYDVRLTIHRDHELTVRTYTCPNITLDSQRFFGAMDIPVQDYAQNSNDYTVKMEAALQYYGVMSDYVALNGNGTCEVPIVISKWMEFN